MNYNMQGMEKTILELFTLLMAAEVEIKKGHQEKGQRKEGELQEE